MRRGLGGLFVAFLAVRVLMSPPAMPSQSAAQQQPAETPKLRPAPGKRGANATEPPLTPPRGKKDPCETKSEKCPPKGLLDAVNDSLGDTTPSTDPDITNL